MLTKSELLLGNKTGSSIPLIIMPVTSRLILIKVFIRMLAFVCNYVWSFLQLQQVLFCVSTPAVIYSLYKKCNNAVIANTSSLSSGCRMITNTLFRSSYCSLPGLLIKSGLQFFSLPFTKVRYINKCKLVPSILIKAGSFSCIYSSQFILLSYT